MKLAAFAALIALLPFSADDTVTFSDAKLGLSFSHPKEWAVKKVEVGKKRKGQKQDDFTTFTIPIEGSTKPAELTVVRAEFSGSAEEWQSIQVKANQNLRREVVRQWDQEILGVPMLLTRINYSEAGNAKSTLTGLLYSKTPLKLLFRLTGQAADFDKAQFAFTTAMESLRTLDGNLPSEQVAGVDPTPAKKETEDPTKQRRILSEGGYAPKKITPEQAANRIDLDLGSSIKIGVPSGWSITERDSQYKLTNPEVSQPVELQLYVIETSESVQTTLEKQSSKELALFDLADRNDQDWHVNLVGAKCTLIWRNGKSKGKPYSTLNGAVLGPKHYLVLHSVLSTGANADKESVLLKKLVEEMSIEAK